MAAFPGIQLTVAAPSQKEICDRIQREIDDVVTDKARWQRQLADLQKEERGILAAWPFLTPQQQQAAQARLNEIHAKEAALQALIDQANQRL